MELTLQPAGAEGAFPMKMRVGTIRKYPMKQESVDC